MKIKIVSIIIMTLLLISCYKYPEFDNPDEILPWIKNNITYQENPKILFSQQPKEVLRRRTAICSGYVGLAMFFLNRFNEKSFFIIVNHNHALLFWRGYFYDPIRNTIILNPNITDILTFDEFKKEYF